MTREEAMHLASVNAPRTVWIYGQGFVPQPTDFATAGADAELARVVEWLRGEALLQEPAKFLRAEDASYPLPRTDCGVPWFCINMALIGLVPGWGDWQARRDMAQIIPVIAAAMEPPPHA